ncbi:hypothetical protein AALA13_02475 [Lachnospiraceae bacterium 50-23]
MDSLFVFREKLREVYAKRSRIFDKIIQFIVAIVTFYLINDNVGFMKMASSPAVTLALAVICTFFPMNITIIAATALILAHMFAVSLAVLAVTALVFLVMYIFYFRLTPKMAFVVLITPVAFVFKIPYVIPLAYGLVSTPMSLIAVSCGTIVYYMMQYVKKAAPGLDGKGKDGFMTQVPAYVKQVFQNKEMWVVVAAFVICLLLVYTIRRQSADHAWKIAIVAGAVINVVIIAAGDIAMGVHTSYTSLVTGNVVAVVIGLILELFFFSVDYARSENLQYEDDEYYYYVKAIPKLSVASPEKTVKRINERQETEIIDTDEVRRKSRKGGKVPKGKELREVKKAKNAKGGAVPKKRPESQNMSSANKHDIDEVNKMLLTQGLKQDLNLKG